MFPAPLPAHVPPPAPTHVHVAPVIAAGNVSVTIAPLAAFGPAFDATIVYVTDVPGTFVAWPSVFVTDTSAESEAPRLTLMQLLPATLWPSGLVMDTFLRPLVVAVTLSVTDVGLLKVTLFTVTPPLTVACKRLGYPGPPASRPGSKNSEPATDTPAIVTFWVADVTCAGDEHSGVAGGRRFTWMARTPQESVALQYSWNVHIV